MSPRPASTAGSGASGRAATCRRTRPAAARRSLPRSARGSSALLEKQPEIGDRDLRAALAAEGVAASLSTVKRFLKLNGLQRKQRRAPRQAPRGTSSQTTT